MPPRTLALAAILATGAVGCGGGDDPDSPEEQVSAVVERYLEAVSDEDWKAVCETRSQKERKEAAEVLGSCEALMARAFRDQPTDTFDGAEIGDIRIKGDKAGVEVVARGHENDPLTLSAVRERGGEWRLEALPEGETP